MDVIGPAHSSVARLSTIRVSATHNLMESTHVRYCGYFIYIHTLYVQPFQGIVQTQVRELHASSDPG